MVTALDFYAIPGAELPLWWVSGPPVDMAELPLSEAVRSRLRAWQEKYTTLDSTSPRAEDFDAEGRELLALVRNELRDGWTVVSSWYDDDAAELVGTLDDPRSAGSSAEEFERLPRATRAEVARLAKKGQRHPDPHVAELAASWAASYTGAAEITFGLIVGIAVDTLTGGLDGSAGVAIAQRRLARRLRAISANDE